MTIIVKHRRTGNEYIVLGINGEVDRVNPSRFISELFTQEKSEISCSVTVCDVRGNIFLAYIDDLVVTEIDGVKPAEILPEPNFESVNYQTRTQPEEDFAEDNSADTETSERPGKGTPISSIPDQDETAKDDFAEDDDWI